MKLLHIIGARPQFIKYFPVQQAIRKAESNYSIENLVIHTGQHYDYRMSKIFFDELGIDEPDYHLEVGSGAHGQQTGWVMQRVEDVLFKEKPDIMIVYGDTNSTLGGAIAAAKMHIPVAHVEAGLRSFNKRMPEEINRILTDHVSAYLFCPSETAVENLRREGFTREQQEIRRHDQISPEIGTLSTDLSGNAEDVTRSPQSSISRLRISPDAPLIVTVGDVMYDMLRYALVLAQEKSTILSSLGLQEKQYILLTLHRAENTDEPKQLATIIRFINEATDGQKVVFPMHPRMVKVYREGPV
ncbi:MAG: UDP-N-acetyl glucosamine 2-epimerase, partial [Deltaproteobacteria bacterium]|nr:UDP-N-acetyl glucosamine 2-epimerase [Deltaproteobacteria bacterium]